LPALGAAVALRVCVRRWRCRHAGCAVRFFTGALPGIAEVYGRRTIRADVVTELVGHALGGRAGERLMGRLGLRVSDDTIVRRLKTRARPAVVDARVVGVDEWAKRKGLNYGTIVVDLERRTVVDVLDTYDVEAVERWFSAHPDIQWYCDAVAVNLRDKRVFLCEITYSKTLHDLNKRLVSWASNWPTLCKALTRDCGVN